MAEEAFDFNAFISQSIDYLQNTFIPSVFAGDVFSIAILGIIAGILLLFFLKATLWLFSVTKRFFLAIIIFISLYFFAINFKDKIFAPEPDFVIIAIGVAGLLLGIVALAISFYSFNKHVKKPRTVKIGDEVIVGKEDALAGGVEIPEDVEAEFRKEAIEAVKEEEEAKKEILKEELKKTLSMGSLREQMQSDKSLLAVLSYVIIAEFGVFSGVTNAAPNIEVGMAFLGVFLLGAFIFIRSTYHTYAKGAYHLIVTAFFGFALSILLGHFWAGTPLETLFSLEYFKSISLVAMITGMAISLFMGSRG